MLTLLTGLEKFLEAGSLAQGGLELLTQPKMFPDQMSPDPPASTPEHWCYGRASPCPVFIVPGIKTSILFSIGKCSTN